MITATALATDPFGPRQAPLPFPPSPPLLPVPVERGDAGQLRHRCARFTQALAEVITGARPVRQLGPWLSRSVYEQLQEHVAGRYAGGPRRSPRVVSLHISMVDEAGAGMAGRVGHHGGSHATGVGRQGGQGAPGRLRWVGNAAGGG